jgi:hypothetical protein
MNLHPHPSSLSFDPIQVRLASLESPWGDLSGSTIKTIIQSLWIFVNSPFHFSPLSDHFYQNLFYRLIGVSPVLVVEDVIESSTRSFLALYICFQFRLYFRLYSHFDQPFVFFPSVAHFSSLPRYHRSYLGEQQLCVYRVYVFTLVQWVVLTSTSHRYLAIIVPT